MKRLFSALSALTLLLAAAPASANHEATGLCEPSSDPQTFILELNSLINSGNHTGPLCLKACKLQLSGCKKVSTAARKCKDNAAKAEHKKESLLCRLGGGTKKACDDIAKPALKMERDLWKQEFRLNKANCESAHQTCKIFCTP
jgi:hypothetical protein